MLQWDQCPVAAPPVRPHTEAMQRIASSPVVGAGLPLRIAVAVGLAAIAILIVVDSAGAQTLKDRGGEARVAGTCTGEATSKLRIRARDGAIELQFELEHSRAGAAWRVAVVHERRVAWRGVRRATATGAAFELDRRLPDLAGTDAVTVTAWGPSGATCRATAVLQAS